MTTTYNRGINNRPVELSIKNPSVYCQTLPHKNAGHYRDGIPLIVSGCNVWLINIIENKNYLASASQILSSMEMNKAAKFIQETDRQRFVIGRIVLRRLLSDLLHCEPQQVPITTSLSYNKPVIDPFFEANLHFNISHSGDFVMVAIANTPVGVDIEHTRSNIDVLGMINEIFSMAEIDLINRSSDPEQTFFLLWTRKEALLKASGIGLVDRLDLVPALDGLHNMEKPALIGLKNNYLTTSVLLNAGYVASVSYQPDNCELVFWKWNP